MPRSLIKLSLCFAAGLVSAFSMAPYNYWFILFGSLGLLYYLVQQSSSVKCALLYGFVFSYGYFLFGLSWVGNALLVDDSPYQWAYPLALFGAPILLTISFTIACGLSRWFFNLKHLSGFFAFVSLLTLSEWIRGTIILDGFPWNTFGYAWVDLLPMAQIVWFDNIFLLTFLTILWASAIGFLAAYEGSKSLLAIFISASLIGCFIYGENRLANYQDTFVEDVDIKIIQPNIPQDEKWDPLKFDQNLSKHITLSRVHSDPKNTTYIIWPETSLNFRYTSDQTSMHLIKQTLRGYPNNAYIFSGLLQYFPERRESYNSLTMINKDGELFNIYNKHHLVPFGEYIPFQEHIPLRPVAAFMGFDRGEGPKTFETPEGLKYSPLICYESIFPDEAIDDSDRPDFMINIANDAWYGDSAGPHQHFTQGIFRSIELGIPFIRSTSTGISTIVNPVGQVLEQTELFKAKIIHTQLPQKVSDPKESNPFKGKIFLILSCFISLLSGAFRFIQKR